MAKQKIDNFVSAINRLLKTPSPENDIAIAEHRSRSVSGVNNLIIAQALRAEIEECAQDPDEPDEIRQYAQQQYQSLPPF